MQAPLAAGKSKARRSRRGNKGDVSTKLGISSGQQSSVMADDQNTNMTLLVKHVGLDLHSRFPSQADSNSRARLHIPYQHPSTFFPPGAYAVPAPPSIRVAGGRIAFHATSGLLPLPSKPLAHINTRSSFIPDHVPSYSTYTGANAFQEAQPPLSTAAPPDTTAPPSTPKDPVIQYQAPPPPAYGKPARNSRSREARFSALPRPTPTPAYLSQAQVAPTQLPSPRPLLVILDLNGVLVHRGRGKTAHTPRADLSRFLDYLFATHHVMVWSSGMGPNVEVICRRVFGARYYAQLAGVWARDSLHLPPHLFAQNVQVYKRLRWVWESATLQQKAASAACACGRAAGAYTQRNTVLVDDSLEKAIAEPFNLIRVDEFAGQDEPVDSQGRGVLMRVVDYLERLKWVDDVSAHMAREPFQPNSV